MCPHTTLWIMSERVMKKEERCMRITQSSLKMDKAKSVTVGWDSVINRRTRMPYRLRSVWWMRKQINKDLLLYEREEDEMEMMKGRIGTMKGNREERRRKGRKEGRSREEERSCWSRSTDFMREGEGELSMFYVVRSTHHPNQRKLLLEFFSMDRDQGPMLGKTAETPNY